MDAARTHNSQAKLLPVSSGAVSASGWSRAAQLAATFFLGVAAGFLGLAGYQSLDWRARGSSLEEGVAREYRIDLNSADRAELLQLPGVGQSLVDRIERYRADGGRFEQVDDLAHVHGVGPATIARLKRWVVASEDGNRPRAGDHLAPKKSALAHPIDINTAALPDLERLPGIGPKLAQRIIAERNKRIFRSVDELRRVPGIGPKVLARLRPFVVVGSESTTILASITN
jgi:competence ComEA-like helix-hairpin-helix protein